MYECQFKQRVTATPSSLEFWPAGGWHLTDAGWQCFYACRDRKIVRRAVVAIVGGCWSFSVWEVTGRGEIAVALQPSFDKPTQPTQCLHAADLAACGNPYMEAAR
jgi:hypothetical protein